MDIEDLKIFAEVNGQVMTPLKTIIRNLIITIITVILLFSLCIGYIVKKIYEDPLTTSISANENTNAYISQTVE